jgi:hypothetical protein
MINSRFLATNLSFTSADGVVVGDGWRGRGRRRLARPGSAAAHGRAGNRLGAVAEASGTGSSAATDGANGVDDGGWRVRGQQRRTDGLARCGRCVSEARRRKRVDLVRESSVTVKIK